MKTIAMFSLAMMPVAFGQAMTKAQVSSSVCKTDTCRTKLSLLNYSATAAFNYTEIDDAFEAFQPGSVGLPLTNLYVQSGSVNLACTAGSTAVVASEMVNNVQTIFATVSLAPVAGTSKVCRVVWDGIFDTAQQIALLQAKVSILLQLSNLVPANTPVFPLNIVLDKTPIKTTRVQPAYFDPLFKATPDTSGNGEVQLEFQLKVNAQGGCAAVPSTVNFRIGAGAGCAPILAAGVGSTKDKTFKATIPSADLAACKTRSVSQLDGTLKRFIDAYVIVVPDATCTSNVTLPVGADHLQFALTSTLGGLIEVTDQTGIANGLWLAVTNVSAVPCNGLFLPMGKLRLQVMSQYTYVNNQTIAQKIYYPAFMDSDVILTRNASAESCSDFNPADGTTGVVNICYNTYESQECLLMEGNAPAECGFVNLGFLNITEKLILSDATQTPTKALVTPYVKSESFRDGQLFKNPECPFVSAQEDLTKLYKPKLTITGESLDQLIINQVELLNETANGPITLAIETVTITMEGFQRVYTLNQKIALMDFPDSEWSTDVHYCRRIVNPTTCSPFYNTESNPFTTSNPSVYSVVNKGHFTCQANNIRNIDIWSFLPSKWVFGQFRGTKSVMTVTVLARISDCQTATQRRLSGSSSSDRELAADAPVKTINATGTINFGEPQVQYTVDVGSSVIVTVLVIVLLILGSCCCFGAVALRRRRDDPTEFSKPELSSSPNSLSNTRV